MGRVEQRIDAPLERYSGSFPDSSIRAIPNRPFSIWDEMVLSHEASGTLIVPDSLGTIDSFQSVRNDSACSCYVGSGRRAN